MQSVALRAARRACQPLRLTLGLRRLSEPPKPPPEAPAASSTSVTESQATSNGTNAVTEGAAAATERPDLAHDYVRNQHFVRPMDKVILAISFKYWPHRMPKRVSNSTMNSAFGRLRVSAATLTIFLMLYIMEIAIRKGRAARDGGDECLYDTPTARDLQARKRQWTRDFELMKAIEEAERERAEKEKAQQSQQQEQQGQAA